MNALLQSIYQDFVKPMIPTLIMIIVLILVAGMSILILGKDNPIEQDIEKIIEADVAGITSSGS